MPVRHDQAPKSFGRRRPVDAPGPERTKSDTSASLLGRTLLVSTVVGFLAVLGTTQLARWIAAGDAPARIVHAAGPVPVEPETTGAITAAGAARGTHLDPCRLADPAPLRP
ncbi:hypothetical protein [Methylobacterium sp. GC_Met_2]|uniref:hypothetical protein n=1 Tax=Methylobacterium sp. GC_Met_2 TaxID=2937376 RepID=UPI00226BB3EE|nr:hypothetical protein [Methylobacterium sp. GC_Met_2]